MSLFNLIEEKLDQLLEGQQQIKKLLSNHQKVPPDEKVYDNAELMHLLNVSPRSLATWRAEGKIKFSKIGKKIYYSEADLSEFLKNNKVNNLKKEDDGKSKTPHAVEEQVKTEVVESPLDKTVSEEEGITKVHVIEQHLRKCYDFRYNVVTGRLEFKVKEQAEYKSLTDYKTNSILNELQKLQIATSISQLRAILHSDFSQEYHPFKQYFYSLPKWDEKTDHIALLAATIKTSNDELWKKCLRKWIVAMVACAVKDGITNHCVIILVGSQGIGKTSWVLNLVPEELADYVFSGNINPNNKDTIIQVSECLLVVLDELETIGKTDLGALKELITKDSVRIRRPYGYHPENLPRRASFAGSVNSKEFLTDTTGSRRFLCFDVSKILYNHDVDMRLVYSHALALFESGDFQYWFNNEEIAEISTSNEQFRNVTIEEELLLSTYEPVAVNDAKLFQSTSEIITSLADKGLKLNRSSQQNMGKALRKNHFNRVKRSNRWVYVLKLKKTEEEKTSSGE